MIATNRHLSNSLIRSDAQLTCNKRMTAWPLRHLRRVWMARRISRTALRNRRRKCEGFGNAGAVKTNQWDDLNTCRECANDVA